MTAASLAYASLPVCADGSFKLEEHGSHEGADRHYFWSHAAVGEYFYRRETGEVFVRIERSDRGGELERHMPRFDYKMYFRIVRSRDTGDLDVIFTEADWEVRDGVYSLAGETHYFERAAFCRRPIPEGLE